MKSKSATRHRAPIPITNKENNIPMGPAEWINGIWKPKIAPMKLIKYISNIANNEDMTAILVFLSHLISPAR